MKQIQNHPIIGSQVTKWYPIRWCLLLFMAVLWSGCRQEAKAPASSNPTDTYRLVSVDGKPLPCTASHEGMALTIKSGSFVINSDGTCSSTITFSVGPGADSTRKVKATYTREGSKLAMRWQGAGTTTGTVQGDTFTMNNEGMLFSYRK